MRQRALLVTLGILISCAAWGRAQTGDNARATADQRMQQAVQLFQQRQHQAAMQAWEQALALYQGLGDVKRQALALENLGTAALELRQLPQAKDYLQRALDLARTLKDTASEGDLLGKLGRVYQGLADYPSTLDAYQQLLTHARASGNRDDEIRALGSLGRVATSLRDYPQAVTWLQQARAVARQQGHRGLEKTAYGALGEAYLGQERYVQAIEAFWQALVLSRELGDSSGQIIALRQLGNCYYFLGDYAKALPHLLQSLHLAQERQAPREQRATLQSLGNVHYALEQWDTASAYYQQALALARTQGDRAGAGRALGNLALVASQRGEYDTALAYYQQDLALAREASNRQAEGQTLANMGIVFLYQQRYATALEHLQQSLGIVRSLGYHRGEGIALTNMGLALLRSGQLLQAETTLRQAIGVLEQVRANVGGEDAHHVSLFETHLRPYRYLQTTLVAQGRATEALHVAEQGRARALLELLTRRQTPAQDTPPAIVAPAVHDIQQLAQTRGLTLVEYALIPEEAALYIWVVPTTGPVVFQQVPFPQSAGATEAGLTTLVSRARQALGVAGRGIVTAPDPARADDAVLQELYRLLVQPIAAHLPADPEAPVVFLPQGPLFLVPFQALRDEAGQPLIARHTLLTAPSIQTLQLTSTSRATHPPGAPSLIVGNPAMPSLPRGPDTPPEPLTSLPGAEQEARAIAALFQQEVLTGTQATKRTVLGRMREARLVHLATHGLLEDLQGLGVPGAIALAPAADDDGFLTAAEVMDLQLQAELVVLSACDTAQGQITGDGVIGLSRSFIAAGVPSVVVSLWSVPDAPTAELMVAFYRHLQRQPHKARALRQAMLETRQRHPAPRDWAAFILVGSAE